MLKINPVQRYRTFFPGLARRTWHGAATLLLLGLEKIHGLLFPDLVQGFEGVVALLGGDLFTQVGHGLVRFGTT